MSLTIEEALKQVKLEAGESSFRVNGWEVEVRIRRAECEPESRMVDADVMLDAWTEFPDPRSQGAVEAKLVSPPQPDVPDIPSAEEFE